MTSLGDRILQRQTKCLTYIFAMWHWRILTCVRIWSSHTGNKGDTLRMLWQATTLWRQQETPQEYQWQLGRWDYQLTFCILWLETLIRITLDLLEVLLNYLCIYTEIGQYLQNYISTPSVIHKLYPAMTSLQHCCKAFQYRNWRSTIMQKPASKEWDRTLAS